MTRQNTKSKPNKVRILASEVEIVELIKWCHRKDKEFQKLPITAADFLVPIEKNSHYDDHNKFAYSYRGICSLKHIANGEKVLFMPEKCLITSHYFVEHLQGNQNFNLHEKFVIFLLTQIHKHDSNGNSGGGSKSEFSPYLNTLPKDFSSHHPGYLSKLQIDLLPKWCLDVIVNQKLMIEKGYEKSQDFLNKTIPPLASITITFSEYCWAWYVVYTRTVFFMRKQDGNLNSEKEMALAPFLDLFNHAPEPNTDVVYDEGKGYSIIAKKDILPKEQIFISYGAHPNHKLFCDYGFIPFQPNQFNCIPLNDREILNISPLTTYQWLHDAVKDQRKMVVINEHGLLKELHLLESELSPNLELLIAISMWQPDKQRFSFEVKKTPRFLEIATDIIMKQREDLFNSCSALKSTSSSSSLIESTCAFLHDCIHLCDKLCDLYRITSR